MSEYEVKLEMVVGRGEIIHATNSRSAVAKWIHSKCSCEKNTSMDIEIWQRNIGPVFVEYFRYRPDVEHARLKQFPCSFEESEEEQEDD